MAKKSSETQEERERLLSQLHPSQREVIENILAACPEMTAADCIEHARAMGL